MSAAFMSQALAQKAPGEILSLLLMVLAEGHRTGAEKNAPDILEPITMILGTSLKCQVVHISWHWFNQDETVAHKLIESSEKTNLSMARF